MQGENTELLNSFAFRLAGRAEKLNLSQVEIAGRLGAKKPRVNNWFQAKNLPRSREQVELAKLLGVRLEWLLHGEGEPEVSSEVQESSTPYGSAVREVSVISWAHAGDAVIYEEMPKHFHGKVATTSRDRKAFALTIEGESMLPDFKPGDRVILEPSNEPHNGKPVVAKSSDDAVKLRIYHRLQNGRIQLASLRPEIYPTEVYTLSDFNWIFPVRELVRTV